MLSDSETLSPPPPETARPARDPGRPGIRPARHPVAIRGKTRGSWLGKALRGLVDLWPLWAVHWVWAFSATLVAAVPGLFEQQAATSGTLLAQVWDNAAQFAATARPSLALTGPAALMVVALMLHRVGLGRRGMALAGVASLAIAALLTGVPDYARALAVLAEATGSLSAAQAVFSKADVVAILVGLGASFAGFCVATQKRPDASSPSLQRGTSDNFGHADWLSMDAARARFPGADPAHGGIVVGEAYRVDQDAGIRGVRFDPRDRRSWGKGGRAPLLIDPCNEGATHALVFAGSGGFKTTSIGIPTMLTWTGSAVVLDPAREIGPMVGDYRRQHLGHTVVCLDPATAKQTGINVLDWIDTTSDQADRDVDYVADWITREPRDGASGNDAFFRGGGRDMIICLLADLLWDPELPASQKTLRTLQRRLVTPENEMRARLAAIHAHSTSAKARDLAGTLKGLVDETFSGIYGNANRETRWLSTPSYADLVSGGAEAVPAIRTRDVLDGRTTVFIQIPLLDLDATPGLARVLVGALVNAAYRADGRVNGRILFMLDEVARLGPMHVLETARDASRKYGLTMLLLYQSLGQLTQQWDRDSKRAWFDSTSWQLFANIQNEETAREVSAMCGEYGVVASSDGSNTSSQSGRGGASSSAGRSESRSEVRRPLIRPEELMYDARADEAFVLAGGTRPLRCGRAIYFRRPEWAALVKQNRFHGTV